MPKPRVFETENFDERQLLNVLWDVLQGVRNKTIAVKEANSVVMAAKEICNIARLQIQREVLTAEKRLPEKEV